MRSVSIVYRRQNKQQEEEKEIRTPALTKRSVDEYYSRLAEREKVKDKISIQKNEMLERMKLTTSKSQRNSDRYNILDTLSIAQISIKKQHETKEKSD